MITSVERESDGVRQPDGTLLDHARGRTQGITPHQAQRGLPHLPTGRARPFSPCSHPTPPPPPLTPPTVPWSMRPKPTRPPPAPSSWRFPEKTNMVDPPFSCLPARPPPPPGARRYAPRQQEH